MDLKLLKMLCKDNKQHHVMFHELYLVSSLLCIALNVRFEIPYKVLLYFETPFLIIFKYYAWGSCGCLHDFNLAYSSPERRPKVKNRQTKEKTTLET